MKAFLITYQDVNGEHSSTLFFCKNLYELLDKYEFDGNINSYKYIEVTRQLELNGFTYKDKPE